MKKVFFYSIFALCSAFLAALSSIAKEKSICESACREHLTRITANYKSNKCNMHARSLETLRTQGKDPCLSACTFSTEAVGIEKTRSKQRASIMRKKANKIASGTNAGVGAFDSQENLNQEAIANLREQLLDIQTLQNQVFINQERLKEIMKQYKELGDLPKNCSPLLYRKDKYLPKEISTVYVMLEETKAKLNKRKSETITGLQEAGFTINNAKNIEETLGSFSDLGSLRESQTEALSATAFKPEVKSSLSLSAANTADTAPHSDSKDYSFLNSILKENTEAANSTNKNEPRETMMNAFVKYIEENESVPNSESAKERMASTIIDQCTIHGCDPSYMLSKIGRESGFNPKAISEANAIGLLQLQNPTAIEVRKTASLNTSEYNPENIEQNLITGILYYQQIKENEVFSYSSSILYNTGPNKKAAYRLWSAGAYAKDISHDYCKLINCFGEKN